MTPPPQTINQIEPLRLSKRLFFRPFGAWFLLLNLPTPYGVGCILSPLRGFGASLRPVLLITLCRDWPHRQWHLTPENLIVATFCGYASTDFESGGGVCVSGARGQGIGTRKNKMAPTLSCKPPQGWGNLLGL